MSINIFVLSKTRYYSLPVMNTFCPAFHWSFLSLGPTLTNLNRMRVLHRSHNSYTLTTFITFFHRHSQLVLCYYKLKTSLCHMKKSIIIFYISTLFCLNYLYNNNNSKQEQTRTILMLCWCGLFIICYKNEKFLQSSSYIFIIKISTNQVSISTKMILYENFVADIIFGIWIRCGCVLSMIFP